MNQVSRQTLVTNETEALSVTWKLGIALLAICLGRSVFGHCDAGSGAETCGPLEWLPSGALLVSASCALFASWREIKAGMSIRCMPPLAAAARRAATILVACEGMAAFIDAFASRDVDGPRVAALAGTILGAILVDLLTRARIALPPR